MLHTNSKSDALLAWCSLNGVSIDPRLRIVSDLAGHVRVLLRRSCNIGSGDSVSEIPKHALLSVRSSSLSAFLLSEETTRSMRPKELDPAFGHGAQLLLAVALYAEMFEPSSSRWAGYLSSLPQADEWDGTGLLWCEHEGGLTPSAECHLEHGVFSDVSVTARWLQGTESENYLTDEHGRRLNDNIRDFYHDVACPLFNQRWPELRRAKAGDRDARSAGCAGTGPSGTWSLDGFRHAYALVCARAFVVDSFHGLAMVPVADA